MQRSQIHVGFWLRSVSLAAIAVTLAVPVVQAQESGLMEIVVTARKREESLQDVPISISAFSTKAVEELGLQSIDDIARFTPGLSFTSAFGRAPGSNRPSVRGVTTVLNGIGNASAASTFIDGVYIGGSTQSTELFNIERVEILKGPQSAQYGRGTYAGAINYVTRKPSRELEGAVDVTLAEHDDRRVSGWVSGPLGERAGFYLAAGHDEYGGDYRNTLGRGEKVGSEESDSVTGKIRFQPSDSLDLTLKLGYQKTEDGHFAIALQPRTLNNCCFRNAAFPRAREYYDGVVPDVESVKLFTDVFDNVGGAGTRLDRKLGSLIINWSFGDGYTLSSLSGFTRDTVDTNIDVSYGGYDPIPLFIPAFGVDLEGQFLRIQSQDQKDFSTELRVSSPVERPLRWTAGLYYYDGEQQDTRNDRVIPPGAVSGRVGQILDNGDLDTDSITNTAVFAGVEYDFTDRFNGTLEARYAEDKIEVLSLNDNSNVLRHVGDGKFKSLTPRLTLGFKGTEQVNYYLNVAKGTKPGDFNSNTPVGRDDLIPVDEETVWNYEVGVKTTLLNGRAIFNAALYMLDLADQQLTQVVEIGNGQTASVVQNVGKSEVKGLELQFNGQMTDRLTLMTTYSYTDSEITEYINVDQADINGWDGVLATLDQFGSVAGKKSPRVPKHMASAFLRYEVPGVDDKRWYVSGDLSYESSKFSQVHNLAETGARTLVGLRFGVDTDTWSGSIWVKNLFDDRTPLDILRYIDRQTGTLPTCQSQLPASLPLAQRNLQCAGTSTSPRGFALTLPRTRQIGASLNFKF
ncbi:MAG TPA: TonB-dependent receptor [Steroidobacteraceae bacterium]|nr:TonB-dependent receptor [Steroidobacteraceae bacterium]HRX89240.1 TonB-dependent receptor [Steroidobacteraceae bacterium]